MAEKFGVDCCVECPQKRTEKKNRIDPTGLERAAKYAHQSWCGWMRWMLQFVIDNPEKVDREKFPETMTERWTRQMETPYCELSEQEKQSDRTEAMRFILAYLGTEMRNNAHNEADDAGGL